MSKAATAKTRKIPSGIESDGDGEDYKKIVQLANDAIYIITPKGFEYVNPAFEKLTGFSSRQLCTNKFNFWNIIHEDDREKIKKREEARRRGDSIPDRYEFRILAKEGEVKTVEAMTVSVGNGGGIKVMGILRDISDRKRIEGVLRESEERYRRIVELGPNGILTLDKKGMVRSCNTAYLKQTGFSRDEIINRHFSKIPTLRVKDIPRYTKVFGSLLKGKTPPPFEFKWVHKDKSVRNGEIHISLLKDKNKLHGIQAVILDVTDRLKTEKELKKSCLRMKKILAGTIESISLIVEMRDPYTAGHQRRVGDLACAIAWELGLPEDQVEGIYMAGIIHDIGKINVPSEILSKPTGLTQTEFLMIKSHAQVGYDILSQVEFPWPVADTVLQHHERLDGSGYPDSLVGEQILLEAKILSVADVVEAMSSHRPYRPALGLSKALREIQRNKGILYDTAVVNACLKVFRKGKFSFDAQKGVISQELHLS
jgi:PAS domain S-box-containing protein/putative nucleotidyltransferase with HDIG domain